MKRGMPEIIYREDMPVFAKRLRYAMFAKGFTAKDIVNGHICTQQFVSCLLSGKNNPSLETAVKLAKLLDVSLDWLSGLED